MSERLRSRLNNPTNWTIEQSEVGVNKDYGPATKYVLYPSGDDDRLPDRIGIVVCKSMFNTPGSPRDEEWYARKTGKDGWTVVKPDEDSAVLTAADMANWIELKADPSEETPPQPN